MRLTCPNCAAIYDVADDAIGPNGRKVRCRACGTSWMQAPLMLELTEADQPSIEPPSPSPSLSPSLSEPSPAPTPPEPPLVSEESALAPPPPFAARRRLLRGPLLIGLLVLIVAGLGIAVALVAWGPRQMAGALGLADRPVPLGIAITKQPDWRMIAGGSELFAVTGRIWNPTATSQPIPDIKADLKDQRGHTVYSWTITRPAATLGPGQSIDFDGAAVDVPRASQRIAVSFITASAR
jgi:predicted Zn finger-like uncharacterized protein